MQPLLPEVESALRRLAAFDVETEAKQKHGRPKGSKNQDKTQVILTEELQRNLT